MVGPREPRIWPFLVVLASLFLFSIAAPRPWHQAAQKRHIAQRATRQTQAEPLATESLAWRPAAARNKIAAERPESFAERSRFQRASGSTATSVDLPAEPFAADYSGIAERDPSPTESPLEAGTDLAASEDEDDLNDQPALIDLADVPLVGDEPSSEITAPDEPSQRDAVGERASGRPALARHEPSQSVRRPKRRPVRPRPGIWGDPTELLNQLDELAWDCETGEWATRVADVVRELTRAADARSTRAIMALGRLRDLTDRNHPLLAAAAIQPRAAKLRRTRYAVLRRLDLWELVPELASRERTTGRVVSVERGAKPGAPTRLGRLLRDLERFEHTGLTDDGRDLSSDLAKMAIDDSVLGERTHRWLESNYRNSNLRVVISSELVNRFVPKQPVVEAPVRDRILGVPTRGWSTTTAQLGVRLIPDPRHVRFSLEVRGLVLARTTSRSGPVTLYSNSDASYIARKLFELGPSGLRAWPAEAEASNSPRLRGVETDYDDVPFLGMMVEGIARYKHAEKAGAVRQVARRKVTTRVQEEVDAAIEPKLTEGKRLVRERLLDPLEGLRLAPTVIDMRTTATRLTMRFRLAGDEQLAACTPRPMALADSLASLQIHQSLLNNVCDRINLDGQCLSVPDLQQRLVDALRLPPTAMTGEYPADLRITFAKRDALRVRFVEDRVEVTLSVAELRKYPKTWRDFHVRIYYRPSIKGLDARFVRDGTVQLWGERVGANPQIALRGIFSKVFSQDREIKLFEGPLLSDARLNDLGVTQCTLTDGWLGLSLGPRNAPATARRTVNELR
jgi:hypothetical protein